jgi:hypothetical protein
MTKIELQEVTRITDTLNYIEKEIDNYNKSDIKWYFQYFSHKEGKTIKIGIETKLINCAIDTYKKKLEEQLRRLINEDK